MPEALTLASGPLFIVIFGKIMDFFLQPLNLGLLLIMLISGALLVRQVARPAARRFRRKPPLLSRIVRAVFSLMYAKSMRWRLVTSRAAS